MLLLSLDKMDERIIDFQRSQPEDSPASLTKQLRELISEKATVSIAPHQYSHLNVSWVSRVVAQLWYASERGPCRG